VCVCCAHVWARVMFEMSNGVVLSKMVVFLHAHDTSNVKKYHTWTNRRRRGAGADTTLNAR
jgi:hypothetical protein